MDYTAVILYDFSHDRQPQAHSLCFGGKIGLEDFLDEFRRNTGTGIMDSDVVAFRLLGKNNIDRSSARHRLYGIPKDINNDTLHLILIGD